MATTSNSNSARWAPYILIAILLVALYFVKKHGEQPTVNDNHVAHNKKVVVDDNPVANNDGDSGLDRHPTAIHYSKHDKCRMECRHIDETEVQEILTIGTINFQKSELDADACKKRYAVEGETHDHQRVRIIFAPCKTIETVVTVIDLGKEWSCDCK
jgi:hypothetical protein